MSLLNKSSSIKSVKENAGKRRKRKVHEALDENEVTAVYRDAPDSKRIKLPNVAATSSVACGHPAIPTIANQCSSHSNTDSISTVMQHHSPRPPPSHSIDSSSILPNTSSTGYVDAATQSWRFSDSALREFYSGKRTHSETTETKQNTPAYFDIRHCDNVYLSDKTSSTQTKTKKKKPRETHKIKCKAKGCNNQRLQSHDTVTKRWKRTWISQHITWKHKDDEKVDLCCRACKKAFKIRKAETKRDKDYEKIRKHLDEKCTAH